MTIGQLVYEVSKRKIQKCENTNQKLIFENDKSLQYLL